MPKLFPLCPIPDISPWFALLCILFVIVSLFAALIAAALQHECKKRQDADHD
jgi:hypothetical protein